MAKNLLTKRKIDALNKGDWLSDGSGLALKGSAPGVGSWVYRKRINGALNSVGLGPFPNVSVESARARRDQIEQSIRDGQSFAATTRWAMTGHPLGGKTPFWEYADQWLKQNKPIPKSGRPRTNSLWRKRIDDYCKLLHPIPIAEIDVTHVRDALMPIWMEKIESANRTRHHLAAIFASAKVEGLVRDNPAAWADNLVHIMPKRRKKVRHHASLAYEDIPRFYAWLESETTITARCVQWAILTGVRPSEAQWTEWSEIDLTSRLWKVPESRMKETTLSTRHIVPMSTEMIRVLSRVQSDQADAGNKKRSRKSSTFVSRGLIFRVAHKLKPVSSTSLRKLLLKSPFGHCTMHGFRATFRTWLEDEMEVSDRVAEACLAHKEPDMKKRAYLRTDYLKQRTPLMEAWGRYLASSMRNNAIANEDERKDV